MSGRRFDRRHHRRTDRRKPTGEALAYLREFWHRVSGYGLTDLPPGFEVARSAFNFMSAAAVLAFGCPGFFRPRVPPPCVALTGRPTEASFYETDQLKATLEELVGFGRLTGGEVRVSLGAVNVRTGASVYFDSKTTRITPEHVMASGALPPGLPAVEIDGVPYWDGGIVSNTPLTFVWDERPLKSALILQVDLFSAAGDAPRNLDEVLERLKDTQYASKQRFSADQVEEIGQLWAALHSLLERLPDELKADPAARKLATLCDNRDWVIGRLINKRLPFVSQTKDYEFSRTTVLENWAADREDMRQSFAGFDWARPSEVDIGPEVRVYELSNGTCAAATKEM